MCSSFEGCAGFIVSAHISWLGALVLLSCRKIYSLSQSLEERGEDNDEIHRIAPLRGEKLGCFHLLSHCAVLTLSPTS